MIVLLAALGAGLGLSAGLAFNLRLTRALRTPLAATLCNFALGALLLGGLWLLGVDGVRPAAPPPLWMLVGGPLGAAYVTLSLVGAARLGVGVSTVAVTLGQVLGALVIAAAGWLGQTPQPPTWAELSSAGLLLGAVALLARDRERGGEQGKHRA